MKTARAVGVVETQHGVGLGEPVESERQIYDRELQPLAAPHRHDLNRRGVAVQPAVAFSRAGAVLHLATQPITQSRQVVTLAMGGFVQELADMREVGHVSFTAPMSQDPLGQARRHHRLEHRRDAAVPGQAGPLPDGGGDLVGQLVAAGGQIGRAVAEEHGGRGGPHHATAVRGVEGIEQPQPLRRRGRREHVGVTRIHHRYAQVRQRIPARDGVEAAVDDHGDIAGGQRPAVELCAARQQHRDVGGEIPGDVRPQLTDRDHPALRRPELRAGDHPQPERIVARCPGEPVAVGAGLDGVHHDVVVAEGRALEHHLQPVHQNLVAAPVLGEGQPLVGTARGIQVGDDVAAAERVDGLLRVADQDDGAVPDESPRDHLPLHRVGVLELVDHDDRPAPAHPVAGRCIGLLQRRGQPAQQVVEAQHPQAALAPFEFLEHRPGERQALRRNAVRIGGDGPQLRAGIADDPLGQIQCFGEAQRGFVALISVGRQVEVGDDLAHQFVEALDQLRS
ncbi:Uncharacterised protein [Mycobacteroides abscessus subsp. abscessus]|nr:Uncharacterised protein [Mycobacteroides abscessus subsp. abscessus]